MGMALRDLSLDVWEPEVLLLQPSLLISLGGASGPGWSNDTVQIAAACLRS